MLLETWLLKDLASWRLERKLRIFYTMKLVKDYLEKHLLTENGFVFQFPVRNRDGRFKASQGCLSRRQYEFWWFPEWHNIFTIWTRRNVCLPSSCKWLLIMQIIPTYLENPYRVCNSVRIKISSVNIEGKSCKTRSSY